MSEQFCPYCMSLAQGGGSCPVCGNSLDGENAAHHLPVGTVLRSQSGHTFLFGAIKGEGGFGLTYIGKERISGKRVAIKEYFPFRCQPQRMPDGSVQPQEQFAEHYAHGMQSFLSEASMLRAVCNIPSIVYVMDYFEANHTAYMVMEYLDGATIYQVVQSRGQIPPQEVFPRFLPLVKDLAVLHEAGVLHRDIAPDNIMWMPDNALKLLDFGCARSLEDGRSMTVILKPGFAPIEQYQTRGQGPYTDTYALCATIYYCLTGKVIPAAPERLSAVFDNQPDPLVPPSAYGVRVCPEQEALLMQGLALQPNVRPGNTAEFARCLEKALQAETGFKTGLTEAVQQGQVEPSSELPISEPAILEDDALKEEAQGEGSEAGLSHSARGENRKMGIIVVGIAAVMILAGLAWLVASVLF